MKTNTYLSFNGDCAAAFRFYADVLRGEITTMISHGESPMAEEFPPEWHARIMHARLVADEVVLMGGDFPPDYDHPRPSGFCVSLHVDAAAEADRIYAALLEGGRVTMPLERNFWADRFGMLVDRFGIPWMVNYEGSVRYDAPAPAPAPAGGGTPRLNAPRIG